MESKNPVIKEFMGHYALKYDFYSHLASMIGEQVRTELERRGIRAIVTFRAKSPERLEPKLVQRDTRKGDPKHYSNISAIESDIVDLAGVRIALYFPGDLEKVDQLISEMFLHTESIKVFPEQNSGTLSKGFVGYIAHHHRIRLREEGLTVSQKRYATGRAEVQIASVLMHAWAEVDHDLRYKPLQGKLSQDELATLDEVNGLILTGEIALERLQRSIEARVKSSDFHFETTYDLQEFLSTSKPEAVVPETGRLNYLLALLKIAHIDTPEALTEYVNKITEASKENPLADQLIDLITDESPERYALLEDILSKAQIDGETPEVEGATVLGEFLTQWIRLEVRLRELNGSHYPLYTSKLLNPDLEKRGVRQEDVQELYSLRSIRNRLVHGQATLGSSEIQDASQRIKALLTRLPDVQNALKAPKKKSRRRVARV